MVGFHQTIIIGFVGGTPALRYTSADVPVCSFSVAVTVSWNDKTSGEKKENTTWYKVTCWNKLAEIANKYVKKGSLIMATGTVDVHQYNNRHSLGVANLVLTANELKFLSGKPSGVVSNDGDSYGDSYGEFVDDSYDPPPL